MIASTDKASALVNPMMCVLAFKRRFMNLSVCFDGLEL